MQTPQTTVLSIRMPEQQVTKLRLLRTHTGLSLQEHVRRAIDAYLDKELKR